MLLLQTVGLVLLTARICLTGLYRIYPYFFGYLVLLLVQATGGVARLSRRHIRVSLAIAIAISVLLLALEKSSAALFEAFSVIERSIVSSLLIFVLLISVFLVYYPIPLTRNAIYFSIGYAFYFLAKATTLLLLNRDQNHPSVYASLMIATCTVCLFFWAFVLKPSGEMSTVVVGHRWNREDGPGCFPGWRPSMIA